MSNLINLNLTQTNLNKLFKLRLRLITCVHIAVSVGIKKKFALPSPKSIFKFDSSISEYRLMFVYCQPKQRNSIPIGSN